jgi:hypothetical protein
MISEKVDVAPGTKPKSNEGIANEQAIAAAVVPESVQVDAGVGVLDDLAGTMVIAARKPAPRLAEGVAEGENMMSMDVRRLPGSGTHTPDAIG